MNSKIKTLIPPVLGYQLKRSWLWIRHWWYIGNRYQCPVCGHHFRKMMPGGFDLPVLKEKQIVGGGYRENDVCPYCLSTDRDRLIFLYLKYETDFFEKTNSLLHIAPEPALFRIFRKSPLLSYYPATKYAEGFYYGSKIHTADLLDLQFDEASFDWLMCNHVLEHIQDDRKAMKEIFRVLKPGGRAVLQVPFSPILEYTYEDPSITSKEEREKHFGQFDHVRIYGRDYLSRLNSVGFQVFAIDQHTDFKHVTNIDNFATNPNEKLFICIKPDTTS